MSEYKSKNGRALRGVTRPLPATQDELAARKKILAKPNLNDHIDRIHFILWADPKYQNLHAAAWDDEAVEGSLAADNIFAAQMIRAWAKENGDDLVASKKAATIVKSLNVVLRRYEETRAERRTLLHGEQQPSGSFNKDEI